MVTNMVVTAPAHGLVAALTGEQQRERQQR
jgi:hypothetical protein